MRSAPAGTSIERSCDLEGGGASGHGRDDSSFLLLVVRPGAPSSILVTTSKAPVTSSDALVPSIK